MNYKIYYLILLIIFINNINAQDRYCSNNCYLHGNDCTTFMTGFDQPNCNVYFNNNCPPGCIKVTQGIGKGSCGSNEITMPQRNYLCPSGCSYINNECFNSNYQISCTNYTYGINIAPRVSCPLNCLYNSELDICEPINSNYICEFNPITLQCPTNCYYQMNSNACVSSGTNVCSLNKSCYINDYFTFNNTNNLCINDGYPNCLICQYNINTNQCISIDINNVCQPTVKLTCPENYHFNVNYSLCNLYNYNTICMLDQYNIRFPKWMENDLPNITCHYAIENMYCNMRYGTVVGCPDHCYYDDIRNTCYSPSGNNYMCGSVDIICPIGSIYTSGWQSSCSDVTNPTCPENYMLINITECSYNMNAYYYCGKNRCVPKWYYE